MGKVTPFLIINFQRRETSERVSAHMSQEAFAVRLIYDSGLDNTTTNYKISPFRSGHPIDAVKHVDLSPPERDKLKNLPQSYAGSLL